MLGNIKGVNLGGWLVYEKWMGSPYLKGVAAADDHDMVTSHSKEQLAEILKPHWDNYITEDDFKWMACNGVNAVRLPIPYHLFGTEHHIPCVGYVDKAMDWAARNGIKVLLDLHTAPMSQNGYDNGGYTGLCAWHHSESRVEWTRRLLEVIASRYGIANALLGIEVLNEPASDFAVKQNARKFASLYPERVRVSSGVPHRLLKDFYISTYRDITRWLKDDALFVINDRYQPKAWNYVMYGGLFRNVAIDTHKYILHKDWRLKDNSLESYIWLIEQLGEEVAESSRFHDVIVGEWSLATSCRNKPCDNDEWFKAIAKAQMEQWEKCLGSFFWSYRNDAEGFESWSFRKCVENGWIRMEGR